MTFAWIIIRFIIYYIFISNFKICKLPLILQLQGRQGSSADFLWWFALQCSQWGPSVLSLQLTQRPPLPVLRYCSMSNTQFSDLPLQLHTAGPAKKKGEKAGERSGEEVTCEAEEAEKVKGTETEKDRGDQTDGADICARDYVFRV